STYIGIKKDEFQVLDKEFILAMVSKNSRLARAEYMKAMFICKEEHKDYVEFKNEKTKYESKRYIIERNISWENVMKFICRKFNISMECIQTKNLRQVSNSKALMIILMRSLCNMNYDEICRIIGNLTESRVSKLSNMGLSLISDDIRYKNIFNEFLCAK
ncbi:MAG: transposase, partial [Clostridium sp.]